MPSSHPSSLSLASTSTPSYIPFLRLTESHRISRRRPRSLTSTVFVPTPPVQSPIVIPNIGTSSKGHPIRARSRTISDTDSSCGRSCKRRHTQSASQPTLTPSSSPSSSSSSSSNIPSTSTPSFRSNRISPRAFRPKSVITSHRRVNNPPSTIDIDIDADPLSPFSPGIESPSSDTELDAMSFLNPATNYLSAKIEVGFSNGGVVEMLGGPNTGSSYSLPGHVTLSFAHLPRNSDKRREIKEINVQMESMSDYFDDHGRYTPFRIHTYSIQLLKEPLVIPSNERTTERLRMTIPFDLRLPGWLPPTHSSKMTNVAHGVTAKATVGWSEVPASPPTRYSQINTRRTGPTQETWMECLAAEEPPLTRRSSTKRSALDQFFNSSLHSRSTATSTSKHHCFNIIRHRLPASITQGTTDRPNERQFTLRPEADPLNPVECIVVCPDWVDINGPDRSMKIALRLRAKKVPPPEPSTRSSSPDSDYSSGDTSSASVSVPIPVDEEGSTPMARMEVKSDEPISFIQELGMEIEEVERFSSVPISLWGQSFPIPSLQPNRAGTRNPLISPRNPMADIGVVLHNDARPHRAAITRQCLLADDGSQRNFFFAKEGLPLAEKWRKVNVVLPMPAGNAKQRENMPHSDLDSPFLRVRHNLKIRITCRSVVSGERKIIVLTTPIRFGTLPGTHPDSRIRCDSHLPAYIQLFHENGDLRECDPLPLYTKDEPDRDIIMAEASPILAQPSPLPPHKTVSPGMPPLPPLAIRRAISPPTAIEIPSSDDDYPMETDSSSSGSDSDGESDVSDSSDTSGSSRSTGSSPSMQRDDIIAENAARLRAEILERQRQRERESDMDRQRRIEMHREREVEREREREIRSQGPPPTPRTPGMRKPLRTTRGFRNTG